MTTFQRCLRSLAASALAFPALLAAGCAAAGSGSGSDSAPGASEVLVTLHDFRSGARFELASESHTDPVAYYSDERTDAVRKVVDDPLMAAFTDELERRGFDAHAKGGRAPGLGASDVIRWGLEVERGGAREHWLIGNGSAPAEWKQFQTCRDMFLELYNATVWYETVAL